MKLDVTKQKLMITALCIINLCWLNACTSNTKDVNERQVESGVRNVQASVPGNKKNNYKELNEVNITTKKVKLAVVYNVEIKDGSIRFLTKSNGCTSAQNFALSLSHSPNNSNETIVSIHLLKPDYCKALTRIVAIEMPLDIANTGLVTIANPKREAPQLNKRRS